MTRAAFFKRLHAELPDWVQRGWVKPQHAQAILDHVAQQDHGVSRLPIAFAFMGALLLGAGVVTFFAANWGAIPKFAKLLLLFGALGASYAAAGYCLTRAHRLVGHGLLLLGALLFGANIFLIAQIYHIDAHFPNGVLIWSLGALAAAVLMRSEPLLILALVLAVLWSGIESVEFDRSPHWPFLILWSSALAAILFHGWILALRIAMAALIVWSTIVLLDSTFFGRYWHAGERTALLQLYVFVAIAVYILGRGMSWYKRWTQFSGPVVTAGAFSAAASLFVLTFPEVQRFTSRNNFDVPTLHGWMGATLAVLLAITLLMIWRYHGTRLSTLPRYRQGAFIWLIVGGALALLNLYTAGRYPGWAALTYNMLAGVGVVWLVMTGMDRKERRIVNLGFILFAALLIARYADTFWTLLDRSYFFMAGGALLMVAGFYIERSRRRVNARISGTRRSSQ
jgi:uncharacterized membrane protein